MFLHFTGDTRWIWSVFLLFMSRTTMHVQLAVFFIFYFFTHVLLFGCNLLPMLNVGILDFIVDGCELMGSSEALE